MIINYTRIRAAFKAFIIHLLLSVFIGACAAILVFFFWYPFPYANLLRGGELFFLLIFIDLVCGPLLTLILFNPKKSKKELTTDLSIIGLVQIAALAYGMWISFQARPMYLVFEVDRFRVVSLNELNEDAQSKISNEYKKKNWRGPDLIGVRSSRSGVELIESIELSSQGYEPSLRPDWWQAYEISRLQVKNKMKKITDLLESLSINEKNNLKTSAYYYFSGDEYFYLPLVSKDNLGECIVVFDKNADITGYMPVNGFR